MKDVQQFTSAMIEAAPGGNKLAHQMLVYMEGYSPLEIAMALSAVVANVERHYKMKPSSLLAPVKGMVEEYYRLVGEENGNDIKGFAVQQEGAKHNPKPNKGRD
jgi:hypothetical protein